MVYCGKPSRACQMCRTRRIKCDETRPQCNQCAKARRQCPGYKDDNEVVFRQDAKAASRRSAAQKAGRASEAGPSAASVIKKEESVSPIESSTSDVTLHGSVSPTLSDSRTSLSGETICASPTISPAQHAACFFISNYILVPQQGSTHGFMDFLVPLLASEPSNGHFTHAFNACAYAALSNRYRTSDNRLGDEALSHYTRALSTTHAALRDPKKSTTDGTLASVLLLGLFENLTAKQMGMFAWGSHIEGAIQLVKARGRKQLRTKTGLILFIAVRTQLIIHSLTSGKAPTMGVDWWLDEAVYVRYSAAVQKLALEVSELRAYVTHLMTTVARTPDNVKLMKDAIQRARAIDDEHIEWMKNLPEYWAPTTVAWEDKVPHGDYAEAEVYPGRVDFYDDVYIASVWNLARVSRIILASLTVRCAAWVCAPVDYRTTPEYATAARICVDTITDVIASVPYQLGWQPRGHTKHGMSSFPCGDEHAIKGLAGYFLTWPLGTLRGLDFTTDAQRTWIVGRLNYIANTLGVRYATILAQLQVRIPSMLIRRDGLMAHSYPPSRDSEKLLAARLAPPLAGSPYALNPLQQREAMQKEDFEQRRAELIKNAAGTKPDTSVQWVARKWLSV